ncbi:hypothetical protein MMYC01_206796 [Madurella mycetomatis]|uniref:Uncharacterized protein n=1 Tax=Madurella mycetomatis TaxID=100816 RepID=A0A175W2Q5_9PEZI|nr:hypothetical protein MMYC01_206796 [Madurella mycetomatis]
MPSPLTVSESQTKAFSNTTVVYVLNATTLITVTTSSKGSMSAAIPMPWNTTASGHLNTSVMYSGFSSPARTPFLRNATSIALFFSNVTTTPSANLSTGAGPNASSGPWLNRSIPAHAPTVTNFRWLNASALQPINATTARWLNTSTPLRSPTPTPTSTSASVMCDPTAASFSLQVSQPGGFFDKWFLRASGSGLLFTSLRSGASFFSIGPVGHLCALDEGLSDRDGLPYVAAVGTRDEVGGSVWLMRKGALEALSDDYTALRCTRAGEAGIECQGRGEVEEVRHWLGCGMQLDLSSHGEELVPVRGLNCSSIGLGVLET